LIIHSCQKQRNEQRESDSDKVVTGGASRSLARKENGINTEITEDTEFTKTDKRVGKRCGARGLAKVAEWTALDGVARRFVSRRGSDGLADES